MNECDSSCSLVKYPKAVDIISPKHEGARGALSDRNITWATNLGHICNIKFSGSHILKSKR